MRPVGRKLDRDRTPIGEWCRAVRAQLQLSQEEFAARLGVGRPTVSDWERGDNLPELGQVLRMIKLSPRAPPLPGQERFLAQFSSDAIDLAAAVNEIDPAVRNAVVERLLRILPTIVADTRSRK